MWPYFNVSLEGHIRQVWLYEHLYMYDIHINLYMLNYEKKEKKKKNINKINNHFSPQTIVRGLGVIVV